MISEISRAEFAELSSLIYDWTGIRMDERKIPLVVGRLAKRLVAYKFQNYREYIEHLKQTGSDHEVQLFVDLITTHVTYFFRESEHYQYLSHYIQNNPGRYFRLWSAASSTGEEAFSAALIFEDRAGSGRYEILGTDISQSSIDHANRALYKVDVLHQIPEYYHRNYLLKGKDEHHGYFTFNNSIRSSVRFTTHNLVKHTGFEEHFKPDIVFLRNVLIYFDEKERQKVLKFIADIMEPGSLLMLGHSETLKGISTPFRFVKTAIYERINEAAG